MFFTIILSATARDSNIQFSQQRTKWYFKGFPFPRMVASSLPPLRSCVKNVQYGGGGHFVLWHNYFHFLESTIHTHQLRECKKTCFYRFHSLSTATVGTNVHVREDLEIWSTIHVGEGGGHFLYIVKETGEQGEHLNKACKRWRLKPFHVALFCYWKTYQPCFKSNFLYKYRFQNFEQCTVAVIKRSKTSTFSKLTL